MSLRSGIINDYSVPMGTSTFARLTRDLNWTIYWFIQVPLDHLSPFIPVQIALISIQRLFVSSAYFFWDRGNQTVYISHLQMTVRMFNYYSH